MRTFYRGPSVHVSDEVFLVRETAVKAFSINQLRDVFVEIHGRRGPVYELRAVYYGQLISLFRTTDQRLFGQIKRALIRALENSDRV
ncbi:hypothetical protein HDA40_007360 [Hamadaea flava]|uniref:DUF6232 family protein n=1 Tax=Hamadaea flava TaxID=1742688 RepID=A0ABV8LZK2_9ACTN|nr:DUF6232 family protein [Hamadaea sp.]MCP2328853.1 hypothetical protein [Hamadaea flava]NUO56264.1 hypothetical protein [Hamadaea sp.]NUR70518.1 hypothetical protein [Hamadaea sp.]NUT04570.1 hypothetical protein [Hamadaea sp.]NUT18125.1 hypothetical protein [Hamadaea sp.]